MIEKHSYSARLFLIQTATSLRSEYGTILQFGWVMPVIKRDILLSISRRETKTTFFAVTPRRYPVSKPKPNDEPETSANKHIVLLTPVYIP